MSHGGKSVFALLPSQYLRTECKQAQAEARRLHAQWGIGLYRQAQVIASPFSFIKRFLTFCYMLL